MSDYTNEFRAFVAETLDRFDPPGLFHKSTVEDLTPFELFLMQEYYLETKMTENLINNSME